MATRGPYLFPISGRSLSPTEVVASGFPSSRSSSHTDQFKHLSISCVERRISTKTQFRRSKALSTPGSFDIRRRVDILQRVFGPVYCLLANGPNRRASMFLGSLPTKTELHG